MATATETAVQPSGAAFQPSPPSTLGFGPREQADDTRQAQHGVVNDAPIDVNPNAVICRSQMTTIDFFGKVWASNMDRREKFADKDLKA